MDEAKYISIIEFAKLLEMTPEYIRRLVANGKIEKNSTITKGTRKFVDPVAARSDLDRNLSHINKRRPGTPEAEPTAPKKTRKRRSRAEQADGEEVLSVIGSAGFEGLTLTEAQTVHERYKAALKKLDYEKREGELLPAEEVKRAWSESIVSARSKILSIKGKIAPLLKEFIEDSANFNAVMAEVEQIEFDALEDLHLGGV